MFMVCNVYIFSYYVKLKLLSCIFWRRKGEGFRQLLYCSSKHIETAEVFFQIK